MSPEQERREFTSELQLQICNAYLRWKFKKYEDKGREFAADDGREYTPLPGYYSTELIQLQAEALHNSITENHGEAQYRLGQINSYQQMNDSTLSKFLEENEIPISPKQSKLGAEIRNHTWRDLNTLEEDKLMVLGAVWYGYETGINPEDFFASDDKYAELVRRVQTPEEFVRRRMRQILLETTLEKAKDFIMRVEMGTPGFKAQVTPEEYAERMREAWITLLELDVMYYWDMDTSFEVEDNFIKRFLPDDYEEKLL